ncbi:hypothetical protein [Chitinophaga sp. HK235]|uniref:hypothetical protein n=1 Tax=Chitinophaga sp. HK235 TaxID=2952571 RepID=UPI001BA8D215|nr:hypothetical protein [Chitinophaga sp. HK235]
MEIVSTHTLSDHLLSKAIYLMIPLGLCMTGEGVMMGVPLLLVMVLYRLNQRFTTALRIHDDHIEVRYFRFFRYRQVRFNIADTVLEIHRYDDVPVRDYSGLMRGRCYYWLHILQRGEIRYHVDSRKGFGKDALMQFLNAFAAARAAV